MSAPAKPPVQRSLRPGQFLFREGESSHCLFLIRKGTIAVRKMKGAAYVELARIYANEIIGELSFFDRQPRNAAAVALTEAEVLEIDFESLEKIYATVPEYMKTIMASVVERLRKADEHIRRLQKDTVDEGGEPEQKLESFSAADALAAMNKSNDADSDGSDGEDPK